MTHWGHGVVIGKFRPPHAGHALLVTTALASVDRLTVFVCADDGDTIPAHLRATWLREQYPAADVRVVETTGFDVDDSPLWARLTRAWLGTAPDVVFTSEAYGDAYAENLGATHVCVDRARETVPVSASQILGDPQAYGEYLAAPVRAYFIPRVVLVGAESTGKTTLARALARHFGTTWVPEHGRTYWDGLLTLPRISPTTDDFVHIAETQQRLEDQLARHARHILVCDTDAFCTRLWHERYVGADAAKLPALSQAPRWRALYVLAGDEIAWEDDGTRERRCLQERAWFQGRFLKELERQERPFIVATGSLQHRLATVVDAVTRLFPMPPAAGGVDPVRVDLSTG